MTEEEFPAVSPVPSHLAERGEVAIFYAAEGFDTGREKLMGRHAAGEGFLSALTRHYAPGNLDCFAQNQRSYAGFVQKLRGFSPNPPPTRFVPWDQPEKLSQAGCLFVPGPGIDPYAWKRRKFSDHHYSLCGVTHTIASARAAEALGNLVTAPTQPWDAVICTSEAVKTAAVRTIDDWRNYLGERFGHKPDCPVQLPVIPLGVDCAQMGGDATTAATRADWRRRMGIREGSVVFLFVGRLSFHAKAHPLPMYLALERAARESGKRIVLIQAGWFANESLKRSFVEGARQYCPMVDVIFIDGRRADVRMHIWHAADVFISLSDNIQETFGLTPVEAMASGLPVVASDWNGYRQTVVDQVTGYMIPTYMPPAESGLELAERFADMADSYDQYIGGASQAIAVDVDAAGAACAALASDEVLRARMGAAGKKRAQDIFDWKHVIRQYRELWIDLAERRTHAAGKPKPHFASDGLQVLTGNPFRIYSHYATRVLPDESVLELTTETGTEALRQIRTNHMNTFADATLAPVARRLLIVELLQKGPASVADLLERLQPGNRDRLRRTIFWMLKCGLVRLA
jgi:starch synthase